MKAFAIFFPFLALAAGLGAATWTGASSVYWNHPGNWSPASVPNSGTDVVINSGTPNLPLVSGISGECHNLTLGPGATLGIFNQPLTVYGDFQNSGLLDMQTASAVLQVNENTFWNSGSTLITNGFCNFYYHGDLTLQSGSNMVMTAGFLRFRGTTLATFTNRSAATQIWHFHNEKTYISTDPSSGRLIIANDAASQPFTIMGNLENGATAKTFNNWTGNIILKGNLSTFGNSPYTLDSFGIGTLVMDGAHQSINFFEDTYNPLNNLVCSQTGTLTLNSDLDLTGNLTIESGVLSAVNHTIELQGNWSNTVGPDAFLEGTSTVSFTHNTDHQYCNYSENFYKLVVAKISGGALRVNNSAAVVTCAQYDWTAGAIDVLAGTFTALDLADDGLVGKYYVNPGANINLTNTDGSIDLNALVNFNGGGTINVYGGTGNSRWENAQLTMSGGVFQFHDQGIYIVNSASYTFSYNVTGGTIRSGGSYQCDRNLAPGAGMLEFTGSGDKYLYMVAGTLNNVRIAKEPGGMVFLVANLNCSGGISVISGTFALMDHEATCAGDLLVYGTLQMNNSLARMYALDGVVWYSTAVGDIAAGAIECGGNWNVYNGSSVVIPAAVTTTLKATLAKTIYNASPAFQFGNLIIGSAAAGAGYTMHTSSTQDLLVAGYLTITTGNELDLNTRNLTLNGALNLNGKLDIHATTATVHGRPYLNAGSNLNIDTGSFVFDDNTLPRQTELHGTLSIANGTFQGVNHALIVQSGSVNTMSGSGAQIICTGLSASAAGTFQPAAGTVKLTNGGSGISTLTVNNGNWLPNLTIDTTVRSYLLGDALTIKGNLTIVQGLLDVSTSNYTITISGNWSNQGGSFNPRSGRVIFTGTEFQYCNYTETFNIVEVNKDPIRALRVDSAAAVVTIAQYDWTAGAVDVLTGTMTINDLYDNGMYGGFYCTANGVLNVTQDGAQRIDLYGIIQVTGGTFNIYGGITDAGWARYSASTVNVSGGNLIYHDRGIEIRSNYALTYSITGGTISTTGQLFCNRTDFIPAGGTFEMTGATDTNLDFQLAPGSSLYNLRINKTGMLTRVSQVASTQTIRGELNVDNGTYYLNNRSLNCLGNLIVWADAVLGCYGASTVRMANGMTLAVSLDGYLDVVGTSEAAKTTFTHYSDGYYTLVIHDGGHLAANYVVFEYMGEYGLYVMASGTIDGLHNCTFQNGIAGGQLLRIDNHQDFTITNANFPTNAGGGSKNVTKLYDYGTIIFSGYSGIFSGAAFERDVYRRVMWTGSSNDLYVSEYSIARPDVYVCAPLTFTITVTNSGSNDIATPFRVDLYKNLASAPPAASLGDYFLEIPSLDAGQSKTVVFNNVSTDVAETWNSWLRLDTTGFVTETNEANNVSGPYLSSWQALPEIANLNIEQTGPSSIQLTWEYSISVSRYNVYRSTDPFFTPAPENLWIQPTSPLVNTSGLQPMYFYRIRAERDLP